VAGLAFTAIGFGVETMRDQLPGRRRSAPALVGRG
jgi:hypothetical protein